MSRFFIDIVKNRTLADVNRVKELLQKRILTVNERNEWEARMIGRFTYEDMNRISAYLNSIRSNTRELYYNKNGVYPSTDILPNTLPTTWTLAAIPQPYRFEDMLKILNCTLNLIGENPIVFSKYDYNYFNLIEDKIDLFECYLAAYQNEGDTIPVDNGWSQRNKNVPLVLTSNYFGYNLGSYYKMVIQIKAMPLNSDLGSYPPSYFGTPQILDVSNCWLTYTQTDIDNNIWREYAFFGGNANNPNTFLKQIILPLDRPLIITNGFRNCQILENVNVNMITEMNSYNFEKCYKINNLNFDSIIEIPSNCFIDCSSLTTLSLGNSLTHINASAFVNCTSLTSITFNGTIAEWNAITLDTGWYDSDTPLTQINCLDGTVNL